MDEIWKYFYDPKIKQQSIESNTGFSRPKKICSQKYVKIVLFRIITQSEQKK